MTVVRLVTALLVAGVSACAADSPTTPTPPLVLAPFLPSIEGTYKFTFGVSPSCHEFPAEVRMRTYTARIAEPSRGAVTVTLSGAVFALGGVVTPGFAGTRDGHGLRFNIGHEPRIGIYEEIGEMTLTYEGSAIAAIEDGRIAGTFSGRLYLFANGNPFDTLGDCDTHDSKIEFTPVRAPGSRQHRRLVSRGQLHGHPVDEHADGDTPLLHSAAPRRWLAPFP